MIGVINSKLEYYTSCFMTEVIWPFQIQNLPFQKITLSFLNESDFGLLSAGMRVCILPPYVADYYYWHDLEKRLLTRAGACWHVSFQRLLLTYAELVTSSAWSSGLCSPWQLLTWQDHCLLSRSRCLRRHSKHSLRYFTRFIDRLFLQDFTFSGWLALRNADVAVSCDCLVIRHFEIAKPPITCSVGVVKCRIRLGAIGISESTDEPNPFDMLFILTSQCINCSLSRAWLTSFKSSCLDFDDLRPYSKDLYCNGDFFEVASFYTSSGMLIMWSGLLYGQPQLLHFTGRYCTKLLYSICNL